MAAEIFFIAYYALSGDDAIFEYKPGTAGLITYVSFPSTQDNTYSTNDGTYSYMGYGPGGLIVDSAGDLFGVTEGTGIARKDSLDMVGLGDGPGGTAFEIQPGSMKFTTLLGLPYNLVNTTVVSPDGYGPVLHLALDANGDIFGETFDGGTNGTGAMFELIPDPSNTNDPYSANFVSFPSYAGVPNDGEYSSFTVDNLGNFFSAGVSTSGDVYADVYEIVSGGTAQYDISGDVLGGPAGLVSDAAGNLYGVSSDTSTFNGVSESETVDEFVHAGHLMFGSSGSTVQPIPTTVLAGSTTNISLKAVDGNGTVITSDNAYVNLDDQNFTTGGSLGELVNGVGTISFSAPTSLGNYAIRVFSSGPGTAPQILSHTFNVVAAAGSQLQVTAQTYAATTGSPVTFTVKLEDQYGNVAVNDNSQVNVSIASGPSGGSIVGTTTAMVSSGLATFSFALDVAGTYYFTFTDLADGNSSVTTTSPTTISAAASQMQVTGQTYAATAGGPVTFTVKLEDQFGNVAVNDTSQLNISIGSGPGGSSIVGTTIANVSNGLAMFNIALDVAGTYYFTFTDPSDGNIFITTSAPTTISAAAASELALPTNLSNINLDGTETFVATVEDSYGNPVAPTGSVKVNLYQIGSSGVQTYEGVYTATVTGSAAAFSVEIDTSGNYVFAPAGYIGANSNQFAVNGGPASVSTDPRGNYTTTAGTPFNDIYVHVYDSHGVIDSDFSGNVTLSFTSSSDDVLRGTFTQAAQNGTAVFPGISFTDADGYTVVATAVGVPSGSTSYFSVTPGPTARLQFIQQPNNTSAGQPFSPAVQVEEEDQFGNIESGDYTTTVDLSLSNSALGNSDLTGNTRVQVLGGIATFAEVSINTVGTGDQLLASESGTLFSTTSSSFNVTAPVLSLLDVDFTNGTSVQTDAAIIGTAGDIWNNVDVAQYGSNDSYFPLKGADGSSSGVILSYLADGGTTITNSPFNDPNSQNYSDTNLMSAGLEAPANAFYSASLSGLVPGALYDLYLYSGNDPTVGTSDEQFTVNGQSEYLQTDPSVNAFQQDTNFTQVIGVAADSNGAIEIDFGSSDNEAIFSGLQIQPSTVHPPLVLSGSNLYLKSDADGSHLDVWEKNIDSGTPDQSISFDSFASIIVDGISTGTHLTVDYSGGDPLSGSTLSFAGDAQGANILNVVDSGDENDQNFVVDNLGVTISSSFDSSVIAYNNISAINILPGLGHDTLTQNQQPGGGASLSFPGTSSLDDLTINNGIFTVPATAANTHVSAVIFGNVAVSAGAELQIAAPDSQSDRIVLVLDSLTIATSTDAYEGRVDLSSNDLIVHHGDLTILSNELGSGFDNGDWNGEGIGSSAASNDGTHLTALGIELNNDGLNGRLFGAGTALKLFDGQDPAITDVLIKYTYYGDANLDGEVDGSDYSKIDYAYNQPITGWSNGDFNYDNAIDGNDYTLIDNAFNTQGSALATSTAQVAAATTGVASKSAAPVISAQQMITDSSFIDIETIKKKHLRTIDDLGL